MNDLKYWYSEFLRRGNKKQAYAIREKLVAHYANPYSRHREQYEMNANRETERLKKIENEIDLELAKGSLKANPSVEADNRKEYKGVKTKKEIQDELDLVFGKGTKNISTQTMTRKKIEEKKNVFVEDFDYYQKLATFFSNGYSSSTAKTLLKNAAERFGFTPKNLRQTAFIALQLYSLEKIVKSRQDQILTRVTATAIQLYVVLILKEKFRDEENKNDFIEFVSQDWYQKIQKISDGILPKNPVEVANQLKIENESTEPKGSLKANTSVKIPTSEPKKEVVKSDRRLTEKEVAKQQNPTSTQKETKNDMMTFEEFDKKTVVLTYKDYYSTIFVKFKDNKNLKNKKISGDEFDRLYKNKDIIYQHTDINHLTIKEAKLSAYHKYINNQNPTSEPKKEVEKPKKSISERIRVLNLALLVATTEDLKKTLNNRIRVLQIAQKTVGSLNGNRTRTSLKNRIRVLQIAQRAIS